MNETKFTPGEWEAGKWRTTDAGDILGVQVGLGRCICRVSPIDKSDDEDYANAFLIAAAPDLLAACEKIFAHLNARLDTAIKKGGAVPLFDGIGDLHDAINKAKGGDR